MGGWSRTRQVRGRSGSLLGGVWGAKLKFILKLEHVRKQTCRVGDTEKSQRFRVAGRGFKVTKIDPEPHQLVTSQSRFFLISHGAGRTTIVFHRCRMRKPKGVRARSACANVIVLIIPQWSKLMKSQVVLMDVDGVNNCFADLFMLLRVEMIKMMKFLCCDWIFWLKILK